MTNRGKERNKDEKDDDENRKNRRIYLARKKKRFCLYSRKGTIAVRIVIDQIATASATRATPAHHDLRGE